MPPSTAPAPPADAPRITHVLRPHHIAILSIFILVLREPPSQIFNLHVWRVVAQEIAELRPPKTFAELIHAITSGPTELPDEATKMARGMRNVPKHIMTHDGMSGFFVDVIAFVPERDDDSAQSNHLVERKSYFGLFIRRCYLSFFKLSWRGAMKLIKDYKDWVDGKDEGYNLRTTDRSNGLLIIPTMSDVSQYAQMDPFERYEAAVEIGDTQSAGENLRRFFDQRFSENDESGFTQHALLNVARLHYSLGENLAAVHALQEALKIARTANDALTVLHCNNLMKRLMPASDSLREAGKPPPVRANTSALELLWEIKSMLDAGEPLRAAWRKLYQSIGCADAQYSDPEESRWARHAVQATLWSYAGVESLARTHESLVIAFAEPDDADSKLNALRGKARRLLRQGNCGGALIVLLDPETWRGLNLQQYGLWATDVWRALYITARRRGQDALIREFLMPRKPAAPPSWQKQAPRKDYSNKLNAPDSSKQAKLMIEAYQYAEAINPILDALWKSEYRGTWLYHRIAVCQLAQVSIEFGMGGRGRRMIEGCLPQILNGDDLEIRAYACHILAKCIIAESWSHDDPTVPPKPAVQVTALEEALPFLQVSEIGYSELGMYEERLEVIYVMSVCYHNLGLGYTQVEKAEELKEKVREAEMDRDRMAELYLEVDKQRKEAVGMMMDEELREVLDLVVRVGAVISR